MQFSVFDLDQQNIQINVTDSDGQSVNLFDQELPVLSSTVDQLQFIYSLLESDLPVLPTFGPGGTLVFSIGDQEIIATIGPNNELIFENLDDINLLDADDYLAIQLYQNGDDANVLWEWAFGVLDFSPNPIPVDGVVRAKITIGIKADNIPTITSLDNMPEFKIGSRTCEDVRQDEFDTRVFYCTPPPSPNDQEGRFDLYIDGIVVPSIPDLAEGRPLLLKNYIEYTDDAEKGVNKFSESISVAIEESNSMAMYGKKEENLTDEEASDVFMERMSSQVSFGMKLMKDFIRNKDVNDSVSAQFAALRSTNNSLTVNKLENINGSLVGDNGTAMVRGVNIIAIDSIAIETDSNAAMFVISRDLALPTALTVNFNLSGTAINGVDYQLLNESIEIPENQSQIGLMIIPFNDGISEINEEVKITLTPDPEYQIGLYSEAVVEIFDNLNVSKSMFEDRTLEVGENKSFEPSIDDHITVFNKLCDWIKVIPVDFVQKAFANNPSLTFTPPVLGSPTFFHDIESWMQQTSNRIYVGVNGNSTYAVINADEFDLATQTYAVAGKTIDNAIHDNPDAKIIINGAFFNYKIKEPLVTSGVIYNNQVVQPTSTDHTRASYKAALLRYWFGQNRSISNANMGLSYLFGGKGNPPVIDAAIGGLISCIWPNAPGTAQKVTVKMDSDLGVYTGMLGPLYGHGMIGIDRDTGMLIILSKKNKKWQSFFSNQDLLFDSGVDQAVGTDGGSSVALYIKGTKYVVGKRHNGTPDQNNTVTNYFVFTPTP